MDLLTPLKWGLVNPPIANAWLALKESSGVGWIIIGILGVASIFTWTIIFSKWMELRKIRSQSRHRHRRGQKTSSQQL